MIKRFRAWMDRPAPDEDIHVPVGTDHSIFDQMVMERGWPFETIEVDLGI